MSPHKLLDRERTSRFDRASRATMEGQKHVNNILKVRYPFFQKRFRKLSRGRVPKQTCSQSAVRGRVYSWCKERALISAHNGHEPCDDRKREMEDKKQKRKTSAEQKKASVLTQLKSVYTGRDRIILHLCQYVINSMQQQFTVGGLSQRDI